MNNQNIGLLILIGVLVIIAIIYFRRRFKTLVVPNVYLITGPVKSGKTLLGLHLAIKTYKRNLRQFYVQKFFASLIGLGFKYINPPMLYSNLPIAKVRWNYLTKDIIYRRVRIPNKSVVFIDESSIMADSMLYNDEKINNALTLFYKLFAHYTHNGTCILTTQSLRDNHFSAKRCLGSYIYIYDRKKFPFITLMKVREMLSMGGDESVVNNSSEDMELSTRNIVLFNSTYKKYDCCALSSLTDDLPYQVDYETEIIGYKDDLKVQHIVSLQSYGNELNKILDAKYKKVSVKDEKKEGTKNEEKK